MQARMKKYQLTEQQIHQLLQSESVGRLATIGADGFPYISPVHFVFIANKIFIHGLAAGEKINNIKSRPQVCFEIEKLISLIHTPEDPCDTNTEYESVIIRGQAAILQDSAQKVTVLDAVVKKYAPQHAGKSFPENMLKMTDIIEITVQSCTGKYFPKK